MNKDTINAISDTASVLNTSYAGISIWMIVAFIEAALIIFLLIYKGRQNGEKRNSIKNKVMAEGEIDFANVLNSSFHSEELYNQLIRLCHPDRYAPDEEKMAIANDISTRVTESRHSVKALESLRSEAIEKLNIKL